MAFLVKIATLIMQASSKRHKLSAAHQKGGLLDIVPPTQIEKGRSSAYRRLVP
jgi:hypothetical protein